LWRPHLEHIVFHTKLLEDGHNGYGGIRWRFLHGLKLAHQRLELVLIEPRGDDVHGRVVELHVRVGLR
jgi:hypothetical protein